MPTAFTHLAVPLALRAGLGAEAVPTPLLAAGALLAVLPDADVLAFRLGVPYASALGHRGFTHALASAALVAALGAAAHARLRARPAAAFAFLLCAGASHALLDAFTNGGLGVALLWPLDATRHFAPVRPIRVAPLAARALLSARGAAVLRSEATWVWLPCATAAGLLRGWRVAAARTAARPAAP